MSCPTLYTISPFDGLNLFKQKLIGYLAEIHCAPLGTTAYMPPLLSHGNMLNSAQGKQTKLLFEDVFDLESLNELMPHIVFKSSSVDENVSQVQKFDFVDRSYKEIAICKRKTAKLLPAHVFCSDATANRRAGNALASFVTVAGRDKFFQAMVTLKPAKPIIKIAEEFVRERFVNGGTQFFMCLHLRTETDFRDYFKEPPAYYSPEDHAAKISKHMEKYPDYYKGVNNVYVSGDHNKEYFKSTVIPVFGRLFKNIYGHHDVAEFGFNALKNVQRAALDQYICSQALIFIGNRYSGFSELTFYIRIGMKLNRGIGTDLEDMLDFMINNSQDNMTHREGSMERMLTANGLLVLT
jgi:hypothetical protein